MGKTKYLCSNCSNDKFYWEFNPDWKGLRVMEKVCTNCSLRVVTHTLNEASIIFEKENILRELNNKVIEK